MASSLTSVTCDSYRCESSYLYTWKIHHFCCEKIKNNEYLPKTEYSFMLNKIYFNAKLYLSGGSCSERECIIDLSCMYNKSWKTCTKLWVGQKRQETVGTFLSSHDNKEAISLARGKKYCLLKEGNYTISCEVLSVYYSHNPIINEPKEELSTFKADMAELFSSQRHSDVVLVVDGHDLRAHKSILASRSKVFNVMFQNDMQESKTNKVLIPDIKKEVLYEMLRYIYTDEVLISHEMAAELFSAADKYDLPKLRSICERELGKKISIDNCIETLFLSDLHKAETLKAKTITFIRNHRKLVANTKDWERIVNHYSHLIVETNNSNVFRF